MKTEKEMKAAEPVVNQPSDAVREVAKHYRKTGSVRTKDLRNVLGNQAAGASFWFDEAPEESAKDKQ
jgi:hypothetical protein